VFGGDVSGDWEVGLTVMEGLGLIGRGSMHGRMGGRRIVGWVDDWRGGWVE